MLIWTNHAIKNMIPNISYRVKITRDRFLFRHITWCLSAEGSEQKKATTYIFIIVVLGCQSVFIINNVLCDNWNIYHVCCFLRSRIPLNHLFLVRRSIRCLVFLLFYFIPSKKCRRLPFVFHVKFRHVNNRKKKNFTLKALRAIFLLTFC